MSPEPQSATQEKRGNRDTSTSIRTNKRTRIHTLDSLQNDTEMQYHYHYTKITQWNDTISETNSITLIDAIFAGMENI